MKEIFQLTSLAMVPHTVWGTASVRGNKNIKFERETGDKINMEERERGSI